MINFPSSPTDGQVFQDGTPRAWMYSSATGAWIPLDLSLGIGPHRVFTKDDATNLSALTISAGNNASGYAATYGYGAALTLYGGQYTGALGYFQLQARQDSTTATTLTGTPAGALTWGGNTIWHAGNLDSEAGTWTPNVGGTATYTSQFGSYKRLGNVVFVTVDSLKINVIGTGSTGIISGLPFTAAAIAAQSGTCGAFFGAAANFTFVSVYVNASSTQMGVSGIGAAGANMAAPAAFFGNGAEIYASATYFV
jgi:hypothetical protein